jgi:cell division inhibitor SulA
MMGAPLTGAEYEAEYEAFIKALRNSNSTIYCLWFDELASEEKK